MSNVILKKENGLVEPIKFTKEKLNEIKNSDHLCWNCSKARSNMCPKVGDIDKSSIDEYEFITDGYQVVDENNYIDTFIVTKCKEFDLDKERPKAKTLEEKERLKKLKEALIMYYFNTSSPEEAYVNQSEFLHYPELTETEKKAGIVDPYQNRRVTDARGKKPNYVQLINMKKKLEQEKNKMHR